MDKGTQELADEQRSVAAIYESTAVARSYLDKRMQFSWQRLMHNCQVRALNSVIARHRPHRVLEVAPGPARLAVDLYGIANGVMLENSEEMIAIACQRLRDARRDRFWEVMSGNAFELSRVVSAETIDLAYTFRFLRHFREEERRHLYAELRSTLKGGGLLMFDVVGQRVRDRLDRQTAEPDPKEIAIYDVTYTRDSFAKEMHANGFEVLGMTPVLRHFKVQSFLSYKLDDVVSPAIPPIIRMLDWLPSSAPLEWVAVCQKR